MIFVTGGAGYIGSHTCVELLQSGHNVTVYDNLSNSQRESIARVERITGKAVRFIQGDIRDRKGLATALDASQAKAVIHFAGLKAVGESVQDPLRYYDNNVFGTLSLLQAMCDVGIKSLVFSSSATVYGEPQSLPIVESHPLSATSPYGQTKLMIENILRDLFRSDPSWRIGILRYFNPVGAHVSGLIGEDPRGVPNNLMPFVAQVAVGRREYLNVWGNDYPTHDGTGVRDYIHVVDLAVGHVKTLDFLKTAPQCVAVNLGAGKGYSVMDMVKAFERVSGKPIAYRVESRRAGDVAACYADCSAASALLDWKAERGLDDMCADVWRWQQNNPQGFGSAV